MHTLQKQWFILAFFLPLFAVPHTRAAQAPGGPQEDLPSVQLPDQRPITSWPALCQTAQRAADTTSDYVSTALCKACLPTAWLVTKSWELTQNSYQDYARWKRRCEAEIARNANKHQPVGFRIRSEIPEGRSEPIYYMTLIYPEQPPQQR